MARIEVHVISAENLEEALERCACILACKKEAEEDPAVAEKRCDEFIDLAIDLTRNVVNDGNFTKDVELLRERWHKRSLEDKQNLLINLRDGARDMFCDIVGHTKDVVHCYGKPSDNSDCKPTKEKKVSNKKVDKVSKKK